MPLINVIPKELFRAQDGCTYEVKQEALEQSVQSAADDLKHYLTDSNSAHKSTEAASVLLEEDNKKEVIRLMKQLTDALSGKLVATFAIIKSL